VFYFIRKSHLSICILLTGPVLDRTRATRDPDVTDHIRWFSHVQVRILQLTFSEVYVGWFYVLINGRSIFGIFIDGDWRKRIAGLDGTAIQPFEPAWYTWLADFHHPLPGYRIRQGRLSGKVEPFPSDSVWQLRCAGGKEEVGGGWFVRLTIVIRSLLRVWHYFSVADYSGVFYARQSSHEDT